MSYTAEELRVIRLNSPASHYHHVRKFAIIFHRFFLSAFVSAKAAKPVGAANSHLLFPAYSLGSLSLNYFAPLYKAR